MTRVKICGVRVPGPWQADPEIHYIGLNFWPTSKRYAAREVAIAVAAATHAQLVGLFVNQSLEVILQALDTVALRVIQLHGDETPDDVARIKAATGRDVWKAIAIGSAADLDGLDRWPADALLLDAPTPGRGGAGVAFDWTLAARARERYPDRAFILAGGLNPSNVAAAIAIVQPWAVDVASGVEAAPGHKDPAKVDAFLSAVRATVRAS